MAVTISNSSSTKPPFPHTRLIILICLLQLLLILLLHLNELLSPLLKRFAVATRDGAAVRIVRGHLWWRLERMVTVWVISVGVCLRGRSRVDGGCGGGRGGRLLVVVIVR